jgi:hypothetical protein
MPNLAEITKVVIDIRSDITNECQRIQNLMDEYALPTTAVATLESIMANLDELANGTGE